MIELASALKTGLKETDCEFLTPLEPAMSAGVCVINIASGRKEDVYSKLYQEYGIAGASTGGLRLCPHFYNTREHIERAVRGIKALLARR